MTLMQVRGLRLCSTHHTAVVQLDDTQRRLTMTFSADSHEAARLAKMMRCGPQACHPVFDFVRALSHAEPAAPPPGAVTAWLEQVRPDDFHTSAPDTPA